LVTALSLPEADRFPVLTGIPIRMACRTSLRLTVLRTAGPNNSVPARRVGHSFRRNIRFGSHVGEYNQLPSTPPQ